MKIFDSQFTHDGTVYPIEWHEVEDFSEVPREHASQVYGVCFHEDNVVLVTSNGTTLNLPGGTIEQGETYEETFRREIQEETNMRVLAWRPIGYQIVTRPNGSRIWQLRVAARVEKIGDFERDPAGSVIAIKFCKLHELNSNINYAKVGERLEARAAELLEHLLT